MPFCGRQRHEVCHARRVVAGATDFARVDPDPGRQQTPDPPRIYALDFDIRVQSPGNAHDLDFHTGLAVGDDPSVLSLPRTPDRR